MCLGESECMDGSDSKSLYVSLRGLSLRLEFIFLATPPALFMLLKSILSVLMMSFLFRYMWSLIVSASSTLWTEERGWNLNYPASSLCSSLYLIDLLKVTSTLRFGTASNISFR